VAKYNEILVGRFNRFLQRFLSMKGDPPAPQLAGEITPQFQIDDAQNMENRFPAGWRSYGLVLGQAAVAAQHSAIRIFNPIGSGVIGVIEKATIFSIAAVAADSPFISRLQGGVAFTTSVVGGLRDLRQGPSSGSTIQLATGSAVNSTGLGIWQTSYGAGANVTVDAILNEHQELTLAPGDSYTFWSNIVNQALNGAWWWRERPLEEGELT
jgi:hypothetical protein